MSRIVRSITIALTFAAMAAPSAAVATPSPPDAPASLADGAAEDAKAPNLRVLKRRTRSSAPPARSEASSGEVLATMIDAAPLPTAEQLARRDHPYVELIKKFREPVDPGSLGTVTRGRLVGGVTLPLETPHHAVLPGCRERDTNWGTPDLVGVISRAARLTHQALGGPRLMVCNMSVEGGGNIKWSRSHNSGLDADLAFFVKKGGKPVEAPSLLHFNHRLEDTGEEGYTIDVPRNWALVKHLLTHPDVQVQWLFVSRPIRRALLRHARKLGEDRSLIKKAARVLWQPLDSAPHNDHFHLRIYCPSRDRVEGCEQTGPVWGWINDQKMPTVVRAAALSEALHDKSRDRRAAALYRLEEISGHYAAPALAWAWLEDDDDKVRAKAFRLLNTWGERSIGLAFAMENYLRAPGDAFAKDDPRFTRPPAPYAPKPGDFAQPMPIPTDGRDGRDVRMAYRLLGVLGLDQSAPFLARALRSRRLVALPGGQTLPEAEMAAAAARHVMHLDLVEPLLDALEAGHEDVREAALRTLRRIANRDLGADLGDDTPVDKRQTSVKAWRAYFHKRADLDRGALLKEGFAAVDVDLEDPEDWAAVEPLVPLTGRDDCYGYNADRQLRRITGHWTPPNADGEERLERWERWLRKHRKMVRRRAE